MKSAFPSLLIAFPLLTSPALAVTDLPAELGDADVVFLGEVHDNPEHHLRQAEYLAALAPGAVVWEMLSPDQAAALNALEDAGIWDDPEALDVLLGSGPIDFRLAA